MNVSSDDSASRDDGNDARADASDSFNFVSFNSRRASRRYGREVRARGRRFVPVGIGNAARLAKHLI